MNPAVCTASPNTPDPVILSAIRQFTYQCERDLFGMELPEPRLCFRAGDSVIIRNALAEVIGQIDLTQITTSFLN